MKFCVWRGKKVNQEMTKQLSRNQVTVLNGWAPLRELLVTETVMTLGLLPEVVEDGVEM